MDKDDKLRYRVAYFLMALLILNTIATLTAVFLVGLGLLNLDRSVLISLIGETVAHVGAMFLTITRHLFPSSATRSENIR